MPLRPGQRLPDNIDELDGTIKAAILILTLDHQSAGALLKKLPTDTVEEVTRGAHDELRAVRLRARHHGVGFLLEGEEAGAIKRTPRIRLCRSAGVAP